MVEFRETDRAHDRGGEDILSFHEKIALILIFENFDVNKNNLLLISPQKVSKNAGIW